MEFKDLDFFYVQGLWKVVFLRLGEIHFSQLKSHLWIDLKKQNRDSLFWRIGKRGWASSSFRVWLIDVSVSMIVKGTTQ